MKVDRRIRYITYVILWSMNNNGSCFLTRLRKSRGKMFLRKEGYGMNNVMNDTSSMINVINNSTDMLINGEDYLELLKIENNALDEWTAVMAKSISSIGRRIGKGVKVEGDRYSDLEVLSVEDEMEVDKYWDRLKSELDYLGSHSVSKVKKALRVAYLAHRFQKRKSGEPYIVHPVEVAILLSELQMDLETVISGLLHDTVEDTDMTFDEIERLFGRDVRLIVEGETKVSKLPFALGDAADEQAENLRQMFVAMTEDYRIIIVKLADRLHNMRTLRFMKREKQEKISRETLDIFAPLAHRMGIWQYKSELEDTAFMYLYPNEYKVLNKILRRHQTRYRIVLDKSQNILKKILDNDVTMKDQKCDVKVNGRTKELYSLWHKMNKVKNLEQIADVVALRVILYPERDSGVWLCYHVLGLVQHLPGFQVVPTRVKDYISFPKPNGYQSLHTTLLLDGQMVEIQIRTSYMHQVAEYGMASHWAYQETKRREKELYNTPWLSSIKEWQQDFVCSRDFVECVRRELLGKRVFIFLRNGKILNLPHGATVIDAAFQIHTEVGIQMYSAQINGSPVPFSYQLKNGDVVSILTDAYKGRPQTDWMRYAKIRSTRSKLRKFFRTKLNESTSKKALILLSDFLERHRNIIETHSLLKNIPTNMDDISSIIDQDLLIQIAQKPNRQAFLETASIIFKVPLNALLKAETTYSHVIQFANPQQLCQQCLPLLGDEIVGTPHGNFTTVHRSGCQFLNENITTVPLQWSFQGSSLYSVEIVIVANDRKILLSDCSQVVSLIAGDIIKTTSVTNNQKVTFVFLIKVKSTHHLQFIIDELYNVESVISVQRSFGSQLVKGF